MASKKKKMISLSVFGGFLMIVAVFLVIKSFSSKQSITVTLSDENTRRFPEAADTMSPVISYDEMILDHKKIAESERYELYLYEPTLSILLRDKETGAILESTVSEDLGKNNKQWKGFMKSGLVLTIIDGLNDTVQADMVNSTPKVMVSYHANGFRAELEFPQYEISLQIVVSLLEDQLVVEIPDSMITESNPKYSIGTISVYPFLGYSYLDEKEGYMFIPDGNGALIYLDNKEGRFKGGYSQMIYGEDIGFKDSTVESLLWGELQTINPSEYILAPVFGMVHTKDRFGYLGIVESGEERASIEAYPNGATVDYNRIYTKFLKRKIYVQPTSQSNSGSITQVETERTHSDIRVSYCLVSEENANYTGLAVRYRNYLLDEKKLTKKDNTYRTRVDFLGADKEDGLLIKSTISMTTVDDIRQILTELKDAGVTNILSFYKGWQSGGIFDLPVTKLKVESSLGGTRKLKKLVKDMKDSDIELYLYHDALRINPGENNATFNVVKRVDKRVFKEETYMEVYPQFMYQIPKRSYSLLRELGDDFKEEGISGMALSGVTNTIYSYSYSGHTFSRKDTMDAYLQTLCELEGSVDLYLEQPFSYLWNQTNAFLTMPTGTSSYIFIDEEIPFLSIALKGVMPMYSDYINFEANKKEFFLKLVEMGIYPSFYITKKDSSYLLYTNSSDIYSSQYDIYKEEIISYSKELSQVNEYTKDSSIIGHERLDNGVTIVTYDNGVKIYVNYSQQEVIAEGETIPAMSYKVGEAK